MEKVTKYDKETGLMKEFNQSRRSFFSKLLGVGAAIAMPSALGMYAQESQETEAAPPSIEQSSRIDPLTSSACVMPELFRYTP